MKKKILASILASLVLSSLLVASPQNISNISDLKESIAILIDKIQTLENEFEDLKKTPLLVQEENKTQDKNFESKDIENRDDRLISTLADKIQALENEIKKLKKVPLVSQDNKGIKKEKTQEEKSKEEDVVKRLYELEKLVRSLRNNPSNDPLLVHNDKEESKKDLEKKGEPSKESTNDALNRQFKIFTDYVNQRISDLEKKTVQQEVKTTEPLTYVQQSSLPTCDNHCVSKADFSNYKFESIKKYKNLQTQINVLKKQVESILLEIREIKNYYQGS
ncbi:hypothetical protein BKH42_03625 [Helicobacter sp. 13S00482-2]|uniref:hypothetical protein n=1 Tax=Helicobacter sp. 13S00482-2 TaxID=1476200 RepID=UPI000BA74FCD|nr:hypothetical protein [Helicobacter sp. 13S00482-2]PAF53831.1 hypothetical protein BKH42_03625 [Helicobacter sp. 13S00482-2]